MESSERRVQGRVILECPCSVSTDRGRFQCTVRQISSAGAQVEAPEALGEPRDTAQLEIEGPEGDDPLRLPCQVVHVDPNGPGFRVGLEFVDLEPEHQAALDRFVESLLGSTGGGARRHARVCRRIEVTCRSADETRAVMCDISQGGLGLESSEPLAVGEEVTVLVELGGFPQPLELKGMVVHSRQVSPNLYQSGLRFQELAPGRQHVLRDLIQFIITK